MTTVPVRRHNHVRRLASDRVFDGVLYTIAAILTLTALYPMYFIIIASISDPSLVAQGKILLLPRDPNDDKNVIIEIRGGAGGDRVYPP